MIFLLKGFTKFLNSFWLKTKYLDDYLNSLIT